MENDDPQALAELEQAVATLRQAFPQILGRDRWGDFHHPHFDSSVPVEKLDQRPTCFTSDELEPDEADYFFRHAGITIHHDPGPPHWLDYFAGRLANFSIDGTGFQCLDLDILAAWLQRAPTSHWTPSQRGAFDGWILAWLNAALRVTTTNWRLSEEFPERIGVPWSEVRDPGLVLDVALATKIPVDCLLAVLSAINDEPQLIQLWCTGGSIPTEILDPWLATLDVGKILFNAATAEQPWSAAAQWLFDHWDW